MGRGLSSPNAKTRGGGDRARREKRATKIEGDWIHSERLRGYRRAHRMKRSSWDWRKKEEDPEAVRGPIVHRGITGQRAVRSGNVRKKRTEIFLILSTLANPL